jgi:HEAT repeat protein
MGDSEYRRQYAERLDRAAEEQREGYRAFSDKSKPVHERLMGLENAGALTDEDEVAEAIDVILDRKEDAELRAATLLSITFAVSQNPDLAIGLLSDSAESAGVRAAALQVLQASSFRAAAFRPKRPEYLAALRAIIDEPDASLRQRALEVLAQRKDEYAQRRLLEGLEAPSQALVPRGETGSRSPVGDRYDVQGTAHGGSHRQRRIPGGEERQRERAAVAGSDGVRGAGQTDRARRR